MIAGIYVRTSTVRQGEEGTSLETQEEQAKLKATELGYQVDPAYIWRDMESSAYIDRAGVKRMLEAVKSREVDIVGFGRYGHASNRLHIEREKDTQQNRGAVESGRRERDSAETGLHRDHILRQIPPSSDEGRQEGNHQETRLRSDSGRGVHSAAHISRVL